MSAGDYLPELAAVLDRLVPEDTVPPDWSDVVARLGVRGRRRVRSRRLRFTVALAVLLLLLTGVATATYLLVRGPAAGAPGGGLTIAGGPRDPRP